MWLTGTLLFLVGSIEAALASLEVIFITELHRTRAGIFTFLNSSLGFLLMLWVIESPNRAWLYIPWVLGDLVGTQIAIALRRKYASNS